MRRGSVLTPASTHKGIPEEIWQKGDALHGSGSTSWWVIVEEGIGKIKSYEFTTEEHARWLFRERRQARVLLCPPAAEEVSSSSGLNPLALKSIRAKLHSHRHAFENAAAQQRPAAQQEHLAETPTGSVACLLESAPGAGDNVEVEASPSSSPLLCSSLALGADTDSAKIVQIVVTSFSGKTMDMQLPSCRTIRDVKEMIGNAWGMFDGGIRLLHGTSDVANHTSLAALLPSPLSLHLSEQRTCAVPPLELTVLVDHELSLLAKVGLTDLLEMRGQPDSPTLDQSEAAISCPVTPV